MIAYRILLAGFFLALVATEGQSANGRDTSQHEIQNAIGFDQNIGAEIPTGLRFQDASGRTVQLGELLNGKPTVLELAWYSCDNICPITLHNLSTALADLSLEPGKDFNVVTVSIDPTDGVAEAKKARAAMLAAYGQEMESGWKILTGGQPAISRLADAVGFRYVYDEAQDEYAHPAGLMVLDGDGRITRYLFGLEFAARDLKLGLIEAGRGELGSPIDQIVLRCHSFDPATGEYTLAVMTLVRIGGIVSALALAGFVGFWLLRDVRRHRTGDAGGGK